MDVLSFRKLATWGGKIYPSGHFCIWRENGQKTKPFKEAFVSTGAGVFRGRTLQEVQRLYGTERVQQWRSDTEEVDLPAMRQGKAAATNAILTLGSSTPANSEKRRRRGLGGLTSRGKNLVREAAIGLEKQYGKQRLTFWTLTLPSMDESDWVSVCENWSKIVENLKKKLIYWLEKKGCPKHVVAVTELQEKRWKREQYPAWHIHAVYVGRTMTGGWVLTPKRADKLWREAVQEFTSSQYGFQSASKLQRVYKSVGAYLSKYLSKGVSVIEEVERKYPGCVPRSFYICTKSLRNWVDNNTQKSEWIGEWLYQRICDDALTFPWLWAYTIETRPGQNLAVAWLGVVPDPPEPRPLD